MKPLSFAVLLGIVITGCSGVRPSALGVKDGRLSPCPASPNCESSQGIDQERSILPLKYSGEPKEAMAKLAKIIQAMPRTSIVNQTDNYLYAEFTSLIFRFVDDVEFSIDENAKLIQVRSASRLGHSDFGVNRKRIEAIREAWEKTK